MFIYVCIGSALNARAGAQKKIYCSFKKGWFGEGEFLSVYIGRLVLINSAIK